MIPKEIDGAKVLYYTTNQEMNDYGLVEFEEGNTNITGFVIAKYDQSEDYYLFACNLKWEVIGDTVHDSIEKAKEFAGEYYNLESLVWNEMKDNN